MEMAESVQAEASPALPALSSRTDTRKPGEGLKRLLKSKTAPSA